MSVLADIVRIERKVWKEFLIDFQLSKLLDFSWVNLSLFSLFFAIRKRIKKIDMLYHSSCQGFSIGRSRNLSPYRGLLKNEQRCSSLKSSDLLIRNGRYLQRRVPISSKRWKRLAA